MIDGVQSKIQWGVSMRKPRITLVEGIMKGSQRLGVVSNNWFERFCYHNSLHVSNCHVDRRSNPFPRDPVVIAREEVGSAVCDERTRFEQAESARRSLHLSAGGFISQMYTACFQFGTAVTIQVFANVYHL